jgi:hypothetical protein
VVSNFNLEGGVCLPASTLTPRLAGINSESLIRTASVGIIGPRRIASSLAPCSRSAIQALAHLAIAATAIPHGQRRKWLRAIAEQLDGDGAKQAITRAECSDSAREAQAAICKASPWLQA